MIWKDRGMSAAVVRSGHYLMWCHIAYLLLMFRATYVQLLDPSYKETGHATANLGFAKRNHQKGHGTTREGMCRQIDAPGIELGELR